jgi:hypothetical protein
MDTIDRLVIFLSLSALIVCLIMEHQAPVLVGTTKGSIPTDRVNKAHAFDPMEVGPAYLLSALPVVRRDDDVLQVVSEDYSPC